MDLIIYAVLLTIFALPIVICSLLVNRIKKISMLGQIVISSLTSLPIPSVLHSSGSGIIIMVSYYLIMITVPIVFYILFGRMQSGPGSDFKAIRTIIAWILWFVFCRLFFDIHNYNGYFFELEQLISAAYGFAFNRVGAALFACYNLTAIAVSVILSYAIGKLVKILRKE